MVGQFKDDRIQDHIHGAKYSNSLASTNWNRATLMTTTTVQQTTEPMDYIWNGVGTRKGNTTRTKSKGVKFIIKVL